MDINSEDVTIDQPESIDPNQIQVDGGAKASPQIDPDQIQVDQDESKYESGSQMAMTGIEGLARGVSGGLSDVGIAGENKAGLQNESDPVFGKQLAPSIEDVNARKEANPGIATVSEGLGTALGLMRGVGIPGLSEKAAAYLTPKVLGAIGTKAFQGAVSNMAMQSSSEISKSLLGQGDPETPVSSAIAHVGAAGIFGGLLGASFGAIEKGTTKGLEALENAKIGDRASNMLSGIGLATKAHAAGASSEKQAEKLIMDQFHDLEVDPALYKQYKAGIKVYYNGLKKIVGKATDVAAGIIGDQLGGPGQGLSYGVLADKYLAPVVEKILDKPLLGANKLAMPVVTYALSKGQTSGLFTALNYATKAAKGAKAINSGIESIFTATGQQGISPVTDAARKTIKDYIDGGGIDKEMEDSLKTAPQAPEGYAKGGIIAGPDAGSIASLYPTQDTMLNTAKGRVSNYLTHLKPQENPSKLPFDSKPEFKGRHSTYDNAIDIAASPLSLLKHIKDGTLQAEHVKHMTSMYPELHNHLSKKITERVMKMQLDGERPTYKVQQALSLFMGVALNSTFTPQSILAAQATFLSKQPQQAQSLSKPKKGTASLNKMPNSYKTTTQTAESDRSDRK